MNTEVAYTNRDGSETYTLEQANQMSKDELKDTFDVAVQIRIAKDNRNSKLREQRAAQKEKSLTKARKVARKTATKKATKVTQRAKEVSQATGMGSDHCRICGKALSKADSVIAGIGPECALKVGVTVNTPTKEVDSIVDSYLVKKAKTRDTLTVDTLDEDKYITFGDALKAARKAGVSGYAFQVACGGHGGMRPPLNVHFQTVFFKRTRYVPKSVLKHFGDISKAANGN